ncbi:MAG: DciA family protein [Pseudomonadota bacterium]
MTSAKDEPKLKTIASYLKNDQHSYTNLVKKAQTIQQIGKKLIAELDPALRNNCTLANINQDVATIITPSSVWATKLRYSIPQILTILRDNLGQKKLKTIRIKIVPVTTYFPASGIPKPMLSKSSSDFIKQTANSIDDEDLRDVLLRLSSRNKNN